MDMHEVVRGAAGLDTPIVIIGGGHAAAALCGALAAAGQGQRVHLVCEEAELPYHRPPLSKAFLKSPQEALQAHRNETWYAEAGITLHRADPATGIDRAAKTVTLRSGRKLSYGALVLATGAVARRLPGLPAPLHNVAALRHAQDAFRLRAQLDAAQRVTVLGGGFIGLEIAATARALGKSVTVLESAPRLLQRSVSPELAAHVLETHRANGIDIRLNAEVATFEAADDRLASLTINGQREPIELLVMGIGAAPETRLAEAAGLACDNGVVIDPFMQTSDPTILAVGDCANFPDHRNGQRLRLESVQNANDQARTAFATLSGTPQPYCAVPWFWSEQGSMRLQMAGLMPAQGERHRRPGASRASFSLLHYADSRLQCVESVNAPQDHMAARKLLESAISPDAEAACDSSRPLKQFLDASAAPR
jgi:3-phenylpropionate/trans-cinnamate dioxygenase ferredoxin reductase component